MELPGGSVMDDEAEQEIWDRRIAARPIYLGVLLGAEALANAQPSPQNKDLYAKMTLRYTDFCLALGDGDEAYKYLQRLIVRRNQRGHVPREPIDLVTAKALLDQQHARDLGVSVSLNTDLNIDPWPATEYAFRAFKHCCGGPNHPGALEGHIRRAHLLERAGKPLLGSLHLLALLQFTGDTMGSHHPVVTTIELLAAAVLATGGEHQIALCRARHAAATIESVCGSADAAAADAADTVGGYLLGLGLCTAPGRRPTDAHLLESLAVAESSLAVRQASLSPHHPAVSASFHNKGLVLSALGRPDDAMTCLTLAMTLRLFTDRPPAPHRAIGLVGVPAALSKLHLALAMMDIASTAPPGCDPPPDALWAKAAEHLATATASLNAGVGQLHASTVAAMAAHARADEGTQTPEKSRDRYNNVQMMLVEAFESGIGRAEVLDTTAQVYRRQGQLAVAEGDSEAAARLFGIEATIRGSQSDRAAPGCGEARRAAEAACLLAYGRVLLNHRGGENHDRDDPVSILAHAHRLFMDCDPGGAGEADACDALCEALIDAGRDDEARQLQGRAYNDRRVAEARRRPAAARSASDAATLMAAAIAGLPPAPDGGPPTAQSYVAASLALAGVAVASAGRLPMVWERISLAIALLNAGHPAEAQRFSGPALEDAKAEPGAKLSSHETLARAADAHVAALNATDPPGYETAIAVAAPLLAACRGRPGAPLSPAEVALSLRLVASLTGARRPLESADHLERVLATHEARGGNPEYRRQLCNLVAVYAGAMRLDAAASALQRLLRHDESQVPVDRGDVVSTATRLAHVLYDRASEAGREPSDEDRAVMERAIRARAEISGHIEVPYIKLNLVAVRAEVDNPPRDGRRRDAAQKRLVHVLNACKDGVIKGDANADEYRRFLKEAQALHGRMETKFK